MRSSLSYLVRDNRFDFTWERLTASRPAAVQVRNGALSSLNSAGAWRGESAGGTAGQGQA